MKNKTTSQASQTFAKINLAASMFMFGTLGVFVKYIPLPSSMIALVRAIVGVLFLFIYTSISGKRISVSDVKNNILILCISGALIGFNWILLFEAYNYTTVAAATLCYYIAPVFVIIASPFVLKEKLTLKKILCVAAALFGMVLVSGVLQTGTDLSQIKGAALATGAALLYAVIIMLNKLLKNISAYDRTIVQLSSAAAVLIPYVLLTENVKSFHISLAAVILLLTVGIFHTGIAYKMYFGSVSDIDAQTVAVMSYIDPLVAVILSSAVLKEKIDIYGIIGAILILFATLYSEISIDLGIKNKLRKFKG